MMRNRSFKTILLAAVLVAGPVVIVGQTTPAPAQDSSAKQDLKDAGRDTKNAAKDAGNGIKKGTKTAARKTKNGTKKAWNKTKNTTTGAVDGAKEGAKQPD